MQIGYHDNLSNFLKSPVPSIKVIQTFLGRPISFWPSQIKTPSVVRDRLEELGVRVYVHAPYVYSLNHRENTVDGANKLQKLMKEIGLKYMVVHCHSAQPINEWIELINDFIDPQMVLLENMANGNFKTLSELETISEATGCGICIDTAHLSNSADMSRPKDWSRVKLVHCNIADHEKGKRKDNHSSRSILDGDVEWVKNEILRNVNCDIITEVSDSVGVLTECNKINEIIKEIRNDY